MPHKTIYRAATLPLALDEIAWLRATFPANSYKLRLDQGLIGEEWQVVQERTSRAARAVADGLIQQ